MRIKSSCVACLMASVVVLITTLETQPCFSATPTETKPAPTPRIDTSKSGVYRSGRWRYEYTVKHPGERGESCYGKLLFDGEPVARAGSVNEYYQTPWGKFYWAGWPVITIDDHGWVTRALPGKPAGKKLPSPELTTKKPTIMVQVLVAGKSRKGDQKEIAPWVREELKKRKVKEVRVERDWFPLTEESVTLHDTKMLGRLDIRITTPRDPKALTVTLDGQPTKKFHVRRKVGVTKLVSYAMDNIVAKETFYLALRVDNLSLHVPAAMVIRTESNGKTLAVKDTSRVIIQLPGNRKEGLAWEVVSIDGKSVQAQGEVQYLPDLAHKKPPKKDAIGLPVGMEGVLDELGGGVYEVHLRVTGKGKSTVKLAYLSFVDFGSPKKPPEKTFCVTLNVQGVPNSINVPPKTK